MSTLVNRRTVRQGVIVALGGFVGLIDAGDSTTVTIEDLINVFGGNQGAVNRPIVLPGEASADRQRLIQSWVDTTGVATFNNSLSGAPTASAPYELSERGDPIYAEINRAMNTALKESRRQVFSVLPTITGETEYSLRALTWVRNQFDVLDVEQRHSLNLLDNEDFDLWGKVSGPGLANWALSGASGLVTRVAGQEMYGGYSAQLTRAGSDVSLLHNVGLLNRQLIGKTLQIAASVKSASADASVVVFDGQTTTTLTHSGDGEQEWLAGSHLVHADATQLTYACQKNTTDSNATFDRVILHEGSSLNGKLKDNGSRARRPEPLDHEVVNDSVSAKIVLTYPVNRGSQLVVRSLQNYAPLDSDVAVTDLDERTLIAKTIMVLARAKRKNEDETRWNALVSEWQPYAQMGEARARRGNKGRTPPIVVGGA